MPSAITALTFAPLPLPSPQSENTSAKNVPKFGILAVGRANGNIDICEWAGEPDQIQSSQAWVVAKTLPGLYPSKVDSLTFVLKDPETLSPNVVPSLSDLRLFSTGGGSELLEWDLERGCIRRSINSQAGTIWALAPNPSFVSLALGCEDGSVRILSISNDTLIHSRRFDRVKTRILSIAWGPPTFSKRKDEDEEEEEEEWSDTWLVTGCSDSSLRKWDIKTGRTTERMTVDKTRGERTLVWSVGVLGDGTIVSGDSLGIVKFWDHRTCTQIHSFTGHGADVLCLAFGPDGTTVYSSGVDQKITQYALIKTSMGEAARHTSRWVQTSSKRLHSHDVRSLAIWPPYVAFPRSHIRQIPINIAPILASGGLDMSVVVTPIALPSNTVQIINPLATSTESIFGDSYHRRLAYPPGPSCNPATHIAGKARLLCSAGDAHLSMWRLPQRPTTPNNGDIDQPETTDTDTWEKVLEMTFNVNTNIIASNVSDDGKWLVVSDLYESKLFSLKFDSNGDITPKRIKGFGSVINPHLPPSATSTGGVAFAFTPDCSKLIMSTAMTSLILIIELQEGSEPRVLRAFDHHCQSNSLVLGREVKRKTTSDDIEMADAQANSSGDEGSLEAPIICNIHRLSTSEDGQWLATSDDHCRTHIFNLDSVQHHCVLPTFSHPVQSLAFDPTRPNILVLGFPNNTLQIYDVESRQFPSWAKSLCDNLPQRLTHAHDSLLGVSFDPSSKTSYILLWGSTWICKICLDNSVIKGGAMRKRRRREADPDDVVVPELTQDFRLMTNYRPLLCVDFMVGSELVVIERPLVDVLSTLPPAYFKPKYGKS